VAGNADAKVIVVSLATACSLHLVGQKEQPVLGIEFRLDRGAAILFFIFDPPIQHLPHQP
jgi:hypothetical protein